MPISAQHQGAAATRSAWPSSARSAPALSCYRRVHPYIPSQPAAVGALEIYLDGWDLRNVRQMIFGLSVLRNATALQVDSAIATLQLRRGIGSADIHAMLSTEPDGNIAPLS